MQWFDEARFGMFIHWGPYSVSGRGEMVHCMHGLSKTQYEVYARKFTAPRYEPRDWARLARSAGCRYMVLTTKHNDGFCLFDTCTTDWQAKNWGPGRDLVSPYVEACRAEGLKVGLYYSLHDYWQPGGLDNGYSCVQHAHYTRAQFEAYYALANEQLRELCSNYGPIDMLFYDGGAHGLPEDTGSEAGRKMTRMVRKLQPEMAINNRDGNPNDFDTPENYIKASPVGRPWQTCMTIAPQWWGYHDKDGPLKSGQELCWYLYQTAASGGNFLLNVGPRGDGVIPAIHARPLECMGRWLAVNGEAIYSSRRGFNVLSTCGATSVVGENLYVHAFRYEAPQCVFRGLLSPVRRITCFATGKRVAFKQDGDVVRMSGLPRKAPDPVATVYRVEVKGKLKTEFGD